MDIDNEWKNFLSCESGDFSDFDMDTNTNMNMKNQGHEEYVDFDDSLIEKNEYECSSSYETCHKTDDTTTSLGEAPQCTDIYISTKTKIAYLSKPIELKKIFWMIPIIQYSSLDTGVVKKQMKFNSTCQEELDEIKEHLVKERLVDELVITSINNTNESSKGASTCKIKFKDNRKISIGLCRKDIMTYKRNPKAAFFNCFVIILRVKLEETNKYKEFHVKLFNTGKIELPGIQNDSCLELVLQAVLDTLRPHMGEDLDYKKDTIETVLINSNFNCGYFINRERLHSILRSTKYRIESAYDPCSYPGVKCKFYFNHQVGFDREKQNGKVHPEDRQMKLSELIDSRKYTEVSFMVFRTGSGLIVGNCTEKILRFVFEFIKAILIEEYENICILSENPVVKNKQPKLRKRTITYTNEYFETAMVDPDPEPDTPESDPHSRLAV